MDTRVAYTAGLLRTLGLMVIDRAGRGQLQPAQRYVAEKWPNYSAWEGSNFGVNNCEVAALILDEWRFPTELGAAMRSHYLARASDAERPLAVLLNVANGLANKKERGLPGETSWWEITSEKMRSIGLTEDDLDFAAEAAERAFDAATMALAV
jgi:HD-like signal output (HDOD) protein